MSETPILAGDIGGTKSNLALVRGSSKTPEIMFVRTYQNREFTSLAEVVHRFLAVTGLSVTRACFGVAGAVMAGESVLPNLGWCLSEQALARDLGLQSVRLVNDLEATALGIATLSPEQVYILNHGQSRPGGNRALIAAGTGLGMALMLPEGPGWRIAASEGGHVDFAPRDEEQIELLRVLKRRYGHVSCERVVSGPGLVNIYRSLRDEANLEEPDWLADRLKRSDDAAAVIAQVGLANEAAIAINTLDLFLSAYGAVAGNLALTAFSTDGLYIGGGIAPKLLDRFPHSGFMSAFTGKGRFAELLAEIPVYIILEPMTALRGAGSQALSIPL